MKSLVVDNIYCRQFLFTTVTEKPLMPAKENMEGKLSFNSPSGRFSSPLSINLDKNQVIIHMSGTFGKCLHWGVIYHYLPSSWSRPAKLPYSWILVILFILLLLPDLYYYVSVPHGTPEPEAALPPSPPLPFVSIIAGLFLLFWNLKPLEC